MRAGRYLIESSPVVDLSASSGAILEGPKSKEVGKDLSS